MLIRGSPHFEEQAAVAAINVQSARFVADVMSVHCLLADPTSTQPCVIPPSNSNRAATAATAASAASIAPAAPSTETCDGKQQAFGLCVGASGGVPGVSACVNCLNEEGQKMQITPPTTEDELCEHVNECFVPGICPVECEAKLEDYLNCHLQAEGSNVAADGSDAPISCSASTAATEATIPENRAATAATAASMATAASAASAMTSAMTSATAAPHAPDCGQAEFGMCAISKGGDVTACSTCLQDEGEKMQIEPPTTPTGLCDHINVCFGVDDPKCPMECKPDLMKYLNCHLEAEGQSDIECP